MQITIATLNGEVYPIDISEEMEIKNVIVLCQEDAGLSNVPLNDIGLYFNGRLLNDVEKSLKEHGVNAGDVLLIKPLQQVPRNNPTGAAAGGFPMIDFSQIQVPTSRNNGGQRAGPANSQGARGVASGGPISPDNPEAIRQTLLNDPAARAILRDRNPTLSEALESGSLDRFSSILRQQQEDHAKRFRERQDALRRLQDNPFDAEAQRFIENTISEQNLDQLLEHALEHAPETFGSVTMLYINCKVNGHPIKAFVDSGAQSTIMSSACAERCNITRMVDRRFQGIAKGVGTQRIIGKIHLAQLQIESIYLPTSFIVLEDQSMDMLLGLDMLKRHQCILDLQKGVLRIGTSGTETRFLPESELPEHTGHAASGSEEDHVREALQKSVQDVAGLQANENAIRNLVEMGFVREDVIEELRKANWNKDHAVAALLAKGLPHPPSK